MTRQARRTVRAALLLAAMVLWVVLPATAASAHAVLLSTSPGDGARLDEPPTALELVFSEPVGAELGAVRVFDGDGERVDGGEVAVSPDGTTVRAPLPDDLPEGTYVAAYRVTSVDSHVIRGGLVFAVGDAPADADIAADLLADAAGGPWEGVATGLRWLEYAAVLLAAGGGAFLLLVHDRDAGERDALVLLVRLAALVGLVVTLAGVGVHGAVVTGLGAGALTSPGVVSSVVSSGFGASALVRIAGLALLAGGVGGLWSWTAKLATGTGALVAVASFLLVGHTRSTDPTWLVMGANLVHTAAAAVWFGGLVLLPVVLRRRRAAGDAVGGGRLVVRFSTVAGLALAALFVAGLALSWAEVRSPEALTTTAYGAVLRAKVALFAVVAAVAGYNRARLVPALRRAGAQAWPRLVRTVRIEVVGILAVLAATAVLVDLVPARSAVAQPVEALVPMGADHQLQVTVDPARAGANEIHLYVFGPDGRLVDGPEELRLQFREEDRDIGPIEREPFVTGPGHWTYVGEDLALPGRWTLTAELDIDDFTALRAEVPVLVRG